MGVDCREIYIHSPVSLKHCQQQETQEGGEDQIHQYCGNLPMYKFFPWDGKKMPLLQETVQLNQLKCTVTQLKCFFPLLSDLETSADFFFLLTYFLLNFIKQD